MRIIKPEMEITCSKCSMKLGINPDDLHDCTDTHGFYYVNCPICRDFIRLRPSELPKTFHAFLNHNNDNMGV